MLDTCDCCDTAPEVVEAIRRVDVLATRAMADHAQQREALAQVDLARAAIERALRELQSAIAESLTDAHGSLERCNFAEQARTATQENAQLTQRALHPGQGRPAGCAARSPAAAGRRAGRHVDPRRCVEGA